jgi:RTX calcium-binding nonapeptide repeat (4 copies)
MTPLQLHALAIARWLDALRSGKSNDWAYTVNQCVTDGVWRIDKEEELQLVEAVKEHLECSRPEAKSKLREFISQLKQSPWGQEAQIEFIDTKLDIIYSGLWSPDEGLDTEDCTANEVSPASDPEENNNTSSSQASLASTGTTLLSDSLPSLKASSAQTFAALAIATSMRAVAIFLGLRTPIPQADLGASNATAQLAENPVTEAVSFEDLRSIATPSRAIVASLENLNDLTIAWVEHPVAHPVMVETSLRVQVAAIPTGFLGLNVVAKRIDPSQQSGSETTTTVNLAENLSPAMDLAQALDTPVVNSESKIAILLKEDRRSSSTLDSPIDRSVSKNIADRKVEPRDNPWVSPIEKPGDRSWEDSKVTPIVETPVLVPEGPIGPELPLPEPRPPVINNPELPLDVDLPRPVEINLPKDVPTTVVIPSDRPVIEISGFVGVGRGSEPSGQRVLEVDTLQFTGAGQIARYLQMEQQNQDVVITFEGNELVKVVLKNLSLDEIDNLDPLTGASAKVGNIIFAGENTTSDSFDVFSSDWYRNSLLNRNTTTFLNDLDNFVYGFDNSDDVINGQGGNDVLFGLGGNDLLRGGSGDDILNGGLGHNQLVGNSGKDTFVITPGGLSDVMDFTLGTDKIQLAQGTTYDRLTLTNFSEGNRGGTQIWQGNQLVLRVFNVTSTQLTAEQFVPGQNDRLP